VQWTTVFFQHGGGAIGRVPVAATAFPHRRATHNTIVAASWPAENDPIPHRRFVDRYWATLLRFTDGVYVNTMNDEPPDLVEANYQGNLPRLRRLKQKYDPANLFRLNANVRPNV
jgi:FAD/FMN-containing dehydrogenase